MPTDAELRAADELAEAIATLGGPDDPLEAACDHCGADPGQPCKTLCPARLPI